MKKCLLNIAFLFSLVSGNGNSEVVLEYALVDINVWSIVFDYLEILIAVLINFQRTFGISLKIQTFVFER